MKLFTSEELDLTEDEVLREAQKAMEQIGVHPEDMRVVRRMIRSRFALEHEINSHGSRKIRRDEQGFF